MPCINYNLASSNIIWTYHVLIQVAKIIGRERTASYLKDAFLHLLKDPTHGVQSKLFPVLPQILGWKPILKYYNNSQYRRQHNLRRLV